MFSSMPREFAYAVAQAMCTRDVEQADKTKEPSTNGTREAMLASSTVGAPSDMLASAKVCGRGLGLGRVRGQGACRQ